MASTDSRFDIAVIGTGLSQSIAAAALARSGHKVLHIDSNAYYGSRTACLTLQELLEWAKNAQAVSSTPPGVFSSVSFAFYPFEGGEAEDPAQAALVKSRQYALSLTPTLVPSTGPLIDALVASGVSQYSEFRLLDVLGAVDPSVSNDLDARSPINVVPSSKEDIFKDKTLSLISKRKLMKMLQYALGDFEETSEWEGYRERPALDLLTGQFGIEDRIARAIVFSIAGSPSGSELAQTLFPRLRRYMRSSGRYGASPFLIGNYGGLGELAQGFCRACAVGGGTYILGRNISSITRTALSPAAEPGIETTYYSLTIDGLDEPLFAQTILAPSRQMKTEQSSNSCSFLRAIVILSRPIHEHQSLAPSDDNSDTAQNVDTVYVSFPPHSFGPQSLSSPVSCVIAGNGTMSCPHGQSILYVISPISEELAGAATNAAQLLRPYIDYFTKGTGSIPPIFELFFIEAGDTSESVDRLLQQANLEKFIGIDDAPPRTANVTEIGDYCATQGTDAFWRASKMLITGASGDEAASLLPSRMWPEREVAEDDEMFQ
ncbi:FAD/NAD(P)-binding domain-containing protein [Clavulina sp. PMI_390]|nr:FAD/NAD(P)-binding domain-containing protein [Clavulina sp. PMI_390]